MSPTLELAIGVVGALGLRELAPPVIKAIVGALAARKRSSERPPPPATQVTVQAAPAVTRESQRDIPIPWVSREECEARHEGLDREIAAIRTDLHEASQRINSACNGLARMEGAMSLRGAR